MSISHLSHKAETKDSELQGKGTFAKETIFKDELIAIFGGKIIDFTTLDNLPEQAKELCIQIHDDYFIGPTKDEDGGDGDFVNHSCNPNAGLNGQIFLVALRDITTGEEITFDYGTTIFYEDTSTPWTMNCNCGASNCRKTVTSNDWHDSEFQKKYDGYFSYYLQKKIDENKEKIKSWES